jgi:hypothetical protein
VRADFVLPRATTDWRDAQPGLAHRAIKLRTGMHDAQGGEVMLREAAYVWQTCCYVVWPAAARVLVASLPVDAPVDNFLARHVLYGRVRALVAQPMLAMQEAPYEGDIERSGFPPEETRARAEEARAGRGRREAEEWHRVSESGLIPLGKLKADDSMYG